MIEPKVFDLIAMSTIEGADVEQLIIDAYRRGERNGHKEMKEAIKKKIAEI